MKIEIISDLHFEKKEEIESVKATGGDIIIVAGDVSSDMEIVTSFLNYLAKNYKAVLFTLGNIELWHKNPQHSLNKLKNLLKDNIYPLDFLEGVKINGIKFCGGIYFSKSFLTVKDRERIASGNTQFFAQLEHTSRINLHKKIKTFNPNIIITHYPPISTGKLKKIEPTCLKHYNRLWIFGHYHHLSNFFGKDDLNKNTIYVCNCSNQPIRIEIELTFNHNN